MAKIYVGNQDNHPELLRLVGIGQGAISVDGSSVTTDVIPFAHGISTESIQSESLTISSDSININSSNYQMTDISVVPKSYVDSTINTKIEEKVTPIEDEISNISDTILPNIHGIPEGGITDQILTKSSDSDYTVQWSTPNYLKLDGTSVTSVPIPFAQGISTSTINTSDNIVIKSTANEPHFKLVLSNNSPYLATEDEDIVTLKYFNSHQGTDSNAITKDGLTTTTGVIPFAMGISTNTINSIQSGTEIVVTDDFNMNNHRISNVLAPDGDNDAANKAYVDSELTTYENIVTTAYTDYVDGKVDGKFLSITGGTLTGDLTGTRIYADRITSQSEGVFTDTLSENTPDNGINVTSNIYNPGYKITTDQLVVSNYISATKFTATGSSSNPFMTVDLAGNITISPYDGYVDLDGNDLHARDLTIHSISRDDGSPLLIASDTTVSSTTNFTIETENNSVPDPISETSITNKKYVDNNFVGSTTVRSIQVVSELPSSPDPSVMYIVV